jgi:predicted nucleotide-binding protein (sugar kinase/HSP70/actin superfamily)
MGAAAPDVEIRRAVERERERLLRAEGLESRKEEARRPVERPFTADQRPHTTLLFGGLTLNHEELLKGALTGLGYRCENLPVPDVDAFQLGKEYGNNGQCNPTYFTVGNLVQHLQRLRDSGVPKERILEDYGMYEAEYRLALRNSGFDGFRVLLFQQKAGLTQREFEAGLRLDMDFSLSVVSAVAMGDLLNEVGYQIRPYERVAGATDAALAECAAILARATRSRPFFDLGSGPFAPLGRIPWLGRKLAILGKFAQQVTTRHYTDALAECRAILDGVEVDRTRVKPIVKITGEFWAQTTEGDGNYNMFRFLESEGAEVLVEPVITWLLYMLWQVRQGYADRFGLPGNRNPVRHAYRLVRLWFARRILLHEYARFREALGGTAHAPVDQTHLQRLGHPHYHSRSQGGEGHLEVAKNIFYTTNKLCHMVLSLKPFGCMPSTQSDGVQAAVLGRFPDMLYLPVETSGEGEINAHSRVQMALGEARMKAKAELAEAVESARYSLEDIRAYVEGRSELRSGLHKVGSDGRYAGTAARFVSQVAPMLSAQR